MNREDILDFRFVPNYQELDKKTRNEVEAMLLENIEDFQPSYTKEKITQTPEERIEGYVRTVENTILVYLNSEVIGIAVLKLDSLIMGYEDYPKNLNISMTLISKGYRGNGIGQLLNHEIESVNQHILKRPYIFRGTWGNNDKQKHINKKLNYIKLGERSYTLFESEPSIIQEVYYKKARLV